MTTDAGHRTECVTIAEAEHENDDLDSAIDLTKEIEDLDKLQLALDRMLECPHSPSTSLASSSGRETGSTGKEQGLGAVSSSAERLNGSASSSPRKREGLAARRLIRVPCGKTPSACVSDANVQSVPIPFTVFGGAAAARLILVDIVRREDLIGILNPNDVILKIEDVQVSGMLRSEVTRLLEKLCYDNDQIAIEIVPAGAITDDICEILADKQWAELQTTIRDNLYSKTVPYTTRPPREGEIDGEHYRFVSVDEFTRLQTEGLLLEHGTYQGHLYGTPRPEECYEGTAMVSSANKGPLPPNWEIGYAENGDKYFIDHNSGTTTWDDPRDLPPGWEQVDDPEYGTFFVDHINKKTQYERPGTSTTTTMPRYDALPTTAAGGGGHMANGITTNGHQHSPQHQQGNKGRQSVVPSGGGNPYFTRDPSQLRGEMVTTTIIKGTKGLGFTLIGNDASSKGDEFIQVKSVLPGGPAAEDGVLRAGDVLVRVNGELLLGASQSDACRIFVNIPVGDPVAIQVCRGYPLLLDPSNRIITENVYQTGGRSRDLHDIEIVKGPEGFGFTIADSATGQRVKKILYPEQCANLLEGDTIVELDGRNVRAIPHTHLVDMLRECPIGHRGRLVVRRSSPKHRSRTPAAEFRYGEQPRATPLPNVSPRSKTPAPVPGGRHEAEPTTMPAARAQTLQRQPNVSQADVWDGASFGARMKPSSTTLGFATPNYMPLSAFQFNKPNDLITVNLIRKPSGFGFRLLGGSETNTLLTVGQVVPGGAAAEDGRMQEGDEIVEIDGRNVEGVSHAEAVSLLEHAAHNKHVKLVVRRPRMGADPLRRQSLHVERPGGAIAGSGEYDVCLTRNETDGFGFIIISSLNRNGSTIGQILENSPAEKCGRLKVGDRVVAVNGIDILNLSHGEIVGLIKASGLTVRLTIAPPIPDGSPLASSTLNRTSIPNMSYAPSPPSSFIPPPPVFQNGGLYATVGRNTNYSTYSQPSMTPAPFSYTNGSVLKTTSQFSSYPDGGRPIYTTSHINGQLNGISLHDPVPPEQDGPIISVELERGVRGFGFSIRGGQEFGAMPLFVLRIAEDGPAAIDGRLRVGDQLISINGRDTKGLTHEEAIQLIKQHPTVRLTVRRHKLP